LESNNRNPILVVEDVYEIAMQMKRALIKRGHEVIFASSAEEAVQIAGDKLPAMIITDLELPTFEALMRLAHEHENLNGLPIAIIDINEPKLPDQRVRVLSDFEAVDQLIHSLSSSSSAK
jgi:CheY-like chemotaxis protein